MSTEPAPAWMKKVGTILLVAWAALFVLGAIGELFGIPVLREITDLKRVFLR